MNCPSCGSADLIQHESRIVCINCGARFSLVKESREAPGRSGVSGAAAPSYPERRYPEEPSAERRYPEKPYAERQRPEKQYPERPFADAPSFDGPQPGREPVIEQRTGRHEAPPKREPPETQKPAGAVDAFDPERWRSSSYGAERKPAAPKKAAAPVRQMGPERAGEEKSMLRPALVSVLIALAVTLALGLITDFVSVPLIIVIGLCAGGLCFMGWTLLASTVMRKK